MDIVADKNDRLDILEKTTASRLQLLLNSIFPNMFKVTVDYPSNNPDNIMPLLDLKVWVDSNSKILHTFYRKPVSYKGVIQYDSGLPFNMKKTILTNEALRRLSNCSPSLDWKEKAVWISELNLFLLKGGYNQRFRNNLTQKVVGIYCHILSKHVQGTNMYRSDQTIYKARDSSPWYKKLG